MRNNHNAIEDILNLGKIALEKFMDAGQQRYGERNAQNQGNHRTVSREEFDAAFAMLAKTRAIQEDLNERIKAIETKLNLSSPHKARKANHAKTKIAKKQNLPKVKHNEQKPRRS